MDFAKDIAIDQDALDVECVLDAQKFSTYARKLADAENAFDRAKDRLDVVKAEADDRVRRKASEAGEKITESIATNKVTLDSVVRDATDAMLTAKHELNILKGAVRSLDKRSDKIDSLIRLEARQYFAGPKEPRDLSAEMRKRVAERREEVSKETEREVRKRLRRTTE